MKEIGREKRDRREEEGRRRGLTKMVVTPTLWHPNREFRSSQIPLAQPNTNLILTSLNLLINSL
jgi:hypothetical protein